MPHRDDLPGSGRDLTIGEFSRLAMLSARMLRHYDQRGILMPVWTDPYSGYRYYAAEQLRDAHRIVSLRDVGFSVSAIAELLPVFDDPVALSRALVAQRAELEGEARIVEQRIGEVDQLMNRLMEETMSTPTITRTTFPEHTVVYLRDTIASYADEGSLWTRFMELFPVTGDLYGPATLSGATFHDEGYRDSDVDVEAWVTVDAAVDVPDLSSNPALAAAVAGGTTGCRTVAEQDVLKATLLGEYAGVAAISEQLGREIAAQGLRIAGPMFNVYVVGPGVEPDPANWVTDIYTPVASA